MLCISLRSVFLIKMKLDTEQKINPLKVKQKKWKRKCYDIFNAANIYKALKLILIQYC